VRAMDQRSLFFGINFNHRSFETGARVETPA
jgi:hypothetical protein